MKKRDVVERILGDGGIKKQAAEAAVGAALASGNTGLVENGRRAESVDF